MGRYLSTVDDFQATMQGGRAYQALHMLARQDIVVSMMAESCLQDRRVSQHGGVRQY